MDNSVLILTNKRKWSLYFVLSLISFLICLMYLNQFDANNSSLNNKGPIFFIALITGSGLVLSFVYLLTNIGFLKLTHDGFEWHALFYSDGYKWSDVNNFKVNRWGYVIFDIGEEAKKKNPFRNLTPDNLIKLMKLFGDKGCLPDNYGKSPQELTQIMNSWKVRYTISIK